jgi:hypothetical protein
MMRLTFLLLLAPLLAAGEIIEGTVTHERFPIPGCTVILKSAAESRTTVSDAEGRYSFRYVPAGGYELTFQLPGFVPVKRQMEVTGYTVVPPVELSVDGASVVTVSCILGMACSKTPPLSRSDLPWCMDVRWNDALIESIERGNRGAIESLRRRYETAFTYREKHTLAAALLRRVPDDRAIWKDLEERAAVSVRFPRIDGMYSRAFEEYCREHNLSPDEVWFLSVEALKHAASDPRSRPLLREALESGDRQLIEIATTALQALAATEPH